MDKFAVKVQAGFADPSYAWPGVTKRRNGQLAGTTRNVIDLGTLQASQTGPARVGAGRYRLSWESDYAAAVFLGAVFKKRRGSLPARNVPINVLRDFAFAAEFVKAWS